MVHRLPANSVLAYLYVRSHTGWEKTNTSYFGDWQSVSRKRDHRPHRTVFNMLDRAIDLITGFDTWPTLNRNRPSRLNIGVARRAQSTNKSSCDVYPYGQREQSTMPYPPSLVWKKASTKSHTQYRAWDRTAKGVRPSQNPANSPSLKPSQTQAV